MITTKDDRLQHVSNLARALRSTSPIEPIYVECNMTVKYGKLLRGYVDVFPRKLRLQIRTLNPG